jgi:hypothetical protein
MAELVSPGVSITVTDESFYVAAGAGTVPLIVIATGEDKTAADGTGIAKYTTKATAGKVYQINSQRDLLAAYGNPDFKTSGGTPSHGHELNEYGLQAAYSFLGIANRAFVLRADVDLAELEPSTSSPTNPPANGAYWIETDTTSWGIKEYDTATSSWVKQDVLYPNSLNVDSNDVPKNTIGTDGDYAVVYQNDDNVSLVNMKFYHRVSGAWYHIGSTAWNSASGKDFQVARHTFMPATQSTGGALVDGDVMLQMNGLNNGSVIDIKQYSTTSNSWLSQTYSSREHSYQAYADIGVAVAGDLWAKFESETASVQFYRHNGLSTSTALSSRALTDIEIDLSSETATGVSLVLTVNDADVVNGAAGNIEINFHGYDADADGNASVDDVVEAFNAGLSAAMPNKALNFADKITVSNVEGRVAIVNSAGTDIQLRAGNTGITETTLQMVSRTSNWLAVSHTNSVDAPVGVLAEGTLWYDSLISGQNIDLLHKDSSGQWATYPHDVNVTPSEPTLNSLSGALIDGDIWVDSSDLENYPQIYKRVSNSWVLVNNTDRITGDGIVFADMRKNTTSSLDADALDPSFYPVGIIVWNKRASGGNVKKWNASANRWEDYSGNRADGAPHMLRKAQRRAVVVGLQAAVTANQEIRNETTRFNLIASPGYPELMDEMITLNVDRKETAFVIGDAPLRLSADSSSTLNWATNAGNAAENGEDGLTSKYAYSAVYYPHGLSTNLDGTNIVIPSSSIALRTFAFNDQVAFPWFAPAGYQRGVVNNASSVGYVDADTGSFVPVSLNEGQRDSLYLNKINPVANFPARGISIFGQKTLSPTASALDRVNVARLVVYIRERLDDAVKPFLFEPNDTATRADAKAIVDRFLANLVTQRGLYDFVTVCDTTNNTPERIDRNELHIDIAIQPVKSVEFIYIPIRVQNTLGETG